MRNRQRAELAQRLGHLLARWWLSEHVNAVRKVHEPSDSDVEAIHKKEGLDNLA
jgi:hypothetical protein